VSGFGVSKFRGLVLAGSFTVLANCVVRLTNAAIAGNLLGTNALAALNLVMPVLSLITFLSGLIVTGTGTRYSLALGRCDTARAHRYFMQGLWTVLVLGGLLALCVGVGAEAFLGLLGAAPEVSGMARAFLTGVWPAAVLEGVLALLVSLGYADGDARLCALGYGVVFVVNAVVSIACVKGGLDMTGCAVGVVAADLAGVLVLAVHFLRRCNSFRPVWHFDMRDSLRIMGASFGDAASFLCEGLLVFFLNAFVIRRFGSEWLPVAGVAMALWSFLVVFDGLGVALQPIVTVYAAERNTLSVRSVMRAAMRLAVLEGVTLAAFFLIWPESVLRLVGLDDPALAASGVRAVRLACIGFVPQAVAGLFNSYYMFIERPVLAGSLTFLCYLVAPVCTISLGALAGFDGLWLGLAMGPLLGLAVIATYILVRHGRTSLPLLLPHARETKLHVFDLMLTERDIAFASSCVSDVLRTAGVPDSVRVRAALMAEEVFMVVRDRNRKRIPRGEVTLDLNDGVLMTLRDDGEIFNITDADAQISSLRTFLVASVMERHEGRLNLTTTGFNRNVFRF